MVADGTQLGLGPSRMASKKPIVLGNRAAAARPMPAP